MPRRTLVLLVVLALIANLLSRFARAERTPWMHIPENGFNQGWGLLDLNRLWDTGHWQMISTNWTLYAIGQQKLYHHAGAGFRQGLTGFLTLTYSPPASNTIQYFADLGLVYIGLLPRRENDAIGVFGASGRIQQ
jgi:hypothetical protein